MEIAVAANDASHIAVIERGPEFLGNSGRVYRPALASQLR
jgi:hypothetical protein